MRMKIKERNSRIPTLMNRGKNAEQKEINSYNYKKKRNAKI